MPDEKPVSQIGKTVSLTDFQGRERRGVVIDDTYNHDFRLMWQGERRFLVRTQDDLENRIIWVAEVRPDDGEVI